MPFHHVALFEVDPDLGPERLQDIYRKFEDLIAEIPGVESVSMGENVRPTTSNFTHVAVIRFADRESLDAYGPHPKHLEAGEVVSAHTRDFLSLDYEFDSAR